MSGEPVVRVFLFVEEMSLRLAERRLSQYNKSVNRHRPPEGRLLAHAEIVRHAVCKQVSVRRWSVLARAKLRGRSCLA